jgi:hypothetical protein
VVASGGGVGADDAGLVVVGRTGAADRDEELHAAPKTPSSAKVATPHRTEIETRRERSCKAILRHHRAATRGRNDAPYAQARETYGTATRDRPGARDSEHYGSPTTRRSSRLESCALGAASLAAASSAEVRAMSNIRLAQSRATELSATL